MFHNIEKQLESHYKPCELLIPHERYDLINLLHEFGAIEKEDHTEEGIYIIGNIPSRLETQIMPFVVHKQQRR